MGAPAPSPATVVVVLEDATELAVAQLDGRRPDMATVDALLRLQLAARRRGGHVEVRGATDELRGLLELTGLDGLLVLEARGQPELLEELGVQEVVQPRDAPA